MAAQQHGEAQEPFRVSAPEPVPGAETDSQLPEHVGEAPRVLSVHAGGEVLMSPAPAAAEASMPANRTEPGPASTPLRSAYPVEPKAAESQTHGRSVETMNVTVGGDGAPRAEVRFTHRNGTIEMAVRTPDTEVAHSLRAALPELGSTLEAHGFRSEIRAEAPAAISRTTSQSDDFDGPGDQGHRGRFEERNQENQERRQRRQFEKEDYD
jgi:hypothetical protein